MVSSWLAPHYVRAKLNRNWSMLSPVLALSAVDDLIQNSNDYLSPRQGPVCLPTVRSSVRSDDLFQNSNDAARLPSVRSSVRSDDLIQNSNDAARLPSVRSSVRSQVHLIAEVKRASPSKGMLA